LFSINAKEKPVTYWKGGEEGGNMTPQRVPKTTHHCIAAGEPERNNENEDGVPR